MPHCADNAAIPVDLSATVFPPVFGPLITSNFWSPPSASVIGTIGRFSLRSLSSRTGCRNAVKFNSAPSEKFGIAASKSRANRARAKALSNSAIVSTVETSGPRTIRNRSVSPRKMRKISAASSSENCTSWLFASTVSNGSTNAVCPVPLAPCTIPCTPRRCSARTGITKRSFRSVT